MRSLMALGALALAIGPWSGVPAAAADPDELLKYLPKPVNAVAVVNVAAILSTPRAVKGGWAKQDHTEYLAGAVPVNPSVERYLLGKEVSPYLPAQGEVWAVIPLNKPVDVAKFAESQRGSTDTIGDELLAVTPRGSVGVKLADKILGLARTDNRQEVARWVRYAKTASTSQQSRYLNAAVYNVGTRHHILVAIDTEDLFHPKQAGLAVARSQALAGNKDVADAVEAWLAKLTGARFSADITDDGIAAEVRLDSAAPAKVDPAAVKALLIEVLEKNGAMLEDLGAAAAKADGNAVTLTFQVSDPELARIMGVIAPPAAGVAESYSVSVAPAGVTAEATRRYYRAVNRILDDLKAQNKKAKDYTKTAVWHDTAANRIETLSVLNVDPAVIEYGQGTAGRLEAIAESLRGVPVQAAAIASEGYMIGFMPRTSVWGWRGGFRLNPWLGAGPQSIQTNLPEIAKKESDLVKKDAENRDKLWDQIEHQRSDVRRAVAEKSKIDLDAGEKK
jgi:hypothetical protein